MKKISAAVLVIGFFVLSTNASAATWVKQSALADWTSIASSSNGQRLVASPFSGYLYTSKDGGVTWTQRISSGKAHNWYSVSASADGLKLAAADNQIVGELNGGYIYTSMDGGETWIKQSNSGLYRWWSVASSADGTKLIAGDNTNSTENYIHLSKDGGKNWVTQNPGGGIHTWVSVASSADGSKLVAVDNFDRKGYIHTSIDGGATWTMQLGSGQYTWTSVASSADGTKLVATGGLHMYTSTDSGVTWTERASSGVWNHVSSSADGLTLAVVHTAISGRTSKNSVHLSFDGGITWTPQSIPSGSNQPQNVTVSRDGTKVFAVTGAYGTTAANFKLGNIWTLDLNGSNTTSVVLEKKQEVDSVKTELQKIATASSEAKITPITDSVKQEKPKTDNSTNRSIEKTKNIDDSITNQQQPSQVQKTSFWKRIKNVFGRIF